MTAQVSTAIRNAMAATIEATIGVSAILRVRSGPPPANPAASRSGTVLATCQLPSDWMSNPSVGVVSLAGSWADSSADATGRAGHFEIADSTGATVGLQGVAAGPWRASTNYAVGDTVTNDSGKVFRATTAGVSASSGGPTGTGTGITDGAAVWSYIQAAPEMVLDSGEFTAAQSFTIPTFTWTQGNA